MFAAGMDPDQISLELSQQRPIKLLSPVLDPRQERVTNCPPLCSMYPFTSAIASSFAFRMGLFSMRGVIKHQRTILPKDFADLPVPFAVGVVDYETKGFSLIDSGDLPEAVAASCAIPRLFKPVRLGGSGANELGDSRLYADGGVSGCEKSEAFSSFPRISLSFSTPLC